MDRAIAIVRARHAQVEKQYAAATTEDERLMYFTIRLELTTLLISLRQGANCVVG
jgi:hypothetical protein